MEGDEDVGPSVEGSSVVFVNTADEMQDDESLDRAAGCFALVAAKVRLARENARVARRPWRMRPEHMARRCCAQHEEIAC
jgi:hypothetical protein